MITHQLALLQREIWEHRSIYVAGPDSSAKGVMR